MISSALKYYYEHKDDPAYKANKKAYNAKYHQQRKGQINDLKKVPCMDCKQLYDHWIMQFDHRDGDSKVTEVGKLWGSKIKLQAEIEKCDLVCANCHANRTYYRRLQNGN